MPLDLHDAAAIYEAFLAAHERVYGHSTRVPAKIVNLRTVHSARAGHVAMAPTVSAAPRPPARRAIRVRRHDAPVSAAIWDRQALTAELRVPGPAIIEQNDTTVLIEQGWTARLAEGGALLLEADTPCGGA